MREHVKLAHKKKGLVNAFVTVEDGLISCIEETDKEAQLLMLPGFIDIHTHGAAMIDVNHISSRDDIEKLSRFYASHGVTSFLLSVMTDTKDKMRALMKTFSSVLSSPAPAAQIIGIHLEGPFLCQEYKGAMPPELILPGDYEFFRELMELSGGRVKYITIAPEAEGNMELIRRIRTETDVVISMGHSAADYDTAITAVESGVTSATHLFNAMKLFHMHRPAVSGASLERDEVYTEIICDGFHLHPAAVRLIIRTKGCKKVVCITDSIMAAGLPGGMYKLGVNDVIVGDDGDAKLPDGVRAGSTLTLDRAMRNLRSFTDCSWYEISRMLSSNQAKLLNLRDRGKIAEGRRADYCLISPDNEVVRTVVRGKTVFQSQEVE